MVVMEYGDLSCIRANLTGKKSCGSTMTGLLSVAVVGVVLSVSTSIYEYSGPGNAEWVADDPTLHSLTTAHGPRFSKSHSFPRLLAHACGPMARLSDVPHLTGCTDKGVVGVAVEEATLLTTGHRYRLTQATSHMFFLLQMQTLQELGGCCKQHCGSTCSERLLYGGQGWVPDDGEVLWREWTRVCL
jgi:hypothetical protein